MLCVVCEKVSVSVYVCMHAFVSMWECVQICESVCLCAYACMHVCESVFVYLCMYAYVCENMYECVHVCACMCVCGYGMWVCWWYAMHVFADVCTHLHVLTQVSIWCLPQLLSTLVFCCCLFKVRSLTEPGTH